MKAFALAFACLLGGCAVLASRDSVVGCQGADAITTLRGIDLGAREANPVVDWLLAHLGPGGFIAVKAGAALLLLHIYPEVSAHAVGLVNGLTCAAAAHNARVAAKLKSKSGSPAP